MPVIIQLATADTTQKGETAVIKRDSERIGRGAAEASGGGGAIVKRTRMPAIQWQRVVANVPPDAAEMFLSTFKEFKIARSNMIQCTMCADPHPHLMRYRVLSCRSKACEASAAGSKREWRGRVLECLKTHETTIHECDQHANDTPVNRNKRLLSEHKAYKRELCALRLKPARIRNSMTRKFDTELGDLPPLAKVQNYASYYKKTRLKNNDLYDEVLGLIQGMRYTDGEAETQAFTFGPKHNAVGQLTVGDGSDDDPFVIGISTKRLLARLSRPLDSFVFHLDATLKLNHLGYPVVVCGISDRC